MKVGKNGVVANGVPDAGYRSRRYAEAHREWGTPVHLPRCNGWVLERAIPGTECKDAAGLYTLFTCSEWSLLEEDMRDLDDRYVTMTIVTDPFAVVAPAQLERCFTFVRAWKEHFVVDLSRQASRILPARHRRNLAKASRLVEVDVCEHPTVHLDEWCRLYESLSRRHAIAGNRRFSRRSFAVQLRTPGVVMLRARAGEAVVGMHLWFVDRDVAYGHLGATSQRGYETMASYALYSRAIEHFRDKVAWASLGAAPGLEHGADNGLLRFKRGWATGVRPVFLCGKIFEERRYALLSSRDGEGSVFFPRYRSGEIVASCVDSKRPGEARSSPT